RPARTDREPALQPRPSTTADAAEAAQTRATATSVIKREAAGGSPFPSDHSHKVRPILRGSGRGPRVRLRGPSASLVQLLFRRARAEAQPINVALDDRGKRRERLSNSHGI